MAAYCELVSDEVHVPPTDKPHFQAFTTGSESLATRLSPTFILLLLGDKGVWWEAIDCQQLQWGSLGCVQEEGVSPKPDEEREH